MRRYRYGENVFQYIQHVLERSEWTQTDVLVTVSFAVLISAGVVFFILTHLMDFDLRGPFSRNLFYLFFILCISYLFWLTDLIFGLPFGWSRLQLLPAVGTAALAWFLVAGVINYWRQKQMPIEKGYRRCPSCKDFILELSVECPHCHSKILKQ